MTEEVQVEQDDNGIAPEIVEKARKFGWVPKEEFHGDVETWRDADEFVKRGDEILGYVRKDRDKALEKALKAENEVNALKATMSEFKKFTDAAEDRAYERALKDLKADKAKAIALGDGDLVIEIDEEIDKVKDQKRNMVAQPAQNQQVDLSEQKVIYDNWLAEGNQIFENDLEVVQMSMAFSDVVRRDPKLKDITGLDFLEEVAKRVKKALPEKFENPARTRASAVGNSSDAGAGRSGAKKRSYADLPADAKKACDDFVTTKIDGKPLMTQEDYVKKYFEGVDK